MKVSGSSERTKRSSDVLLNSKDVRTIEETNENFQSKRFYLDDLFLNYLVIVYLR